LPVIGSFSRSASEKLCHSLKLIQQATRLSRQITGDFLQAVIDVILDEKSLRIPDGGFDRLKLLGDVHAGTAGRSHFDRRSQMAFRPLQPGNDGLYAGMVVSGSACVGHQEP
jgi:hypothetical protein